MGSPADVAFPNSFPYSTTCLLTVLYAGREVSLWNRLGHIPEDNDALLVADEKLVGVGGAELNGADLSRLGLGGRLDTREMNLQKNNGREERRRVNYRCTNVGDACVLRE